MGRSRATHSHQVRKTGTPERRQSDRLRPGSSTGATNSSNTRSNKNNQRSRSFAEASSDSGAETENYEDEELYEVERIVGKRLGEDGSIDYCLKWKNWEGEPTWEPATNCDCKQLIDNFEKKLGNESVRRSRRLK